jgi:hypothetical protein
VRGQDADAVRPEYRDNLIGKGFQRRLRAGEGTLIGADPNATVTVRNALFFEQL